MKHSGEPVDEPRSRKHGGGIYDRKYLEQIDGLYLNAEFHITQIPALPRHIHGDSYFNYINWFSKFGSELMNILRTSKYVQELFGVMRYSGRGSTSVRD